MLNDFWLLLSLATGLAFVLFLLTWLLSLRLDNFSLVDVTWAYSLALLAPIYAWLGQGWPVRKAVIASMTALWSLRLGTYLLRRVARHHPHEEVRYQTLRTLWQGRLARSFFWFFEAQALSIVLLSVPMLVACLNPAPGLSSLEWLGIAVWATGLIGESIADWQMQRFKADPTNHAKVCQVGLWVWSRHPNYFFESLLWWGFWLFACGSPWGWATIFTPLLILHLLLRVTGIPLTEKCAVASKGEAYREYQRTTSAFVPWPRQRT